MRSAVSTVEQQADALFGKLVKRVYQALVATDAVRATHYCSPYCVIRATRRCYGKKIARRGPIEVALHIGRPNYRERQAINVFQEAGEPFSVKKIQLAFRREKK